MPEQFTAVPGCSTIDELFETTRDPFAVFRSRTASADQLVTNSSQKHLQSLTAPFAVAAVGGYGRRELFPYSDVDLLLVFEDESGLASAREPFGDFVRVLWDAGLKVSQSVRTIAECCRLNEQNIELHVSLLDLRFITGDEPLFGTLAGRVREFNRRQAGPLTAKLAAMARQRHEKFQNTAFHLEPNVKDTPGGVRDVHLLHWLSVLSREKEPHQESLAECSACRAFLYQLRCFLHLEAKRDNNLLTFELQDRAAHSVPPAPVAPEEFMRTYYRHARHVFASARRALDFAESQDTSLLRQFRDWRQRLSTAELTVAHERVFLRNPAAAVQSAESALAVFTFVARHGIALSWDAQRRFRGNQEMLANNFHQQAPQWPRWREFFSQAHVSLALHDMQDTGVLAAAIPEWCAIDGLVVRDFYHRYTVDEHTLVAIQAIDELAARHEEGRGRIRELAASGDDRIIVRLALLLHDIGKGTDPGHHVRGSMQTAKQVLSRFGAPEAVRIAVLFLIERHLDLSQVMNTRDLKDPATARLLSSRIGTQEDLRRLVLLTYADISAVNPSAMTPWRLEQLWRAYTVASGQLMRELTADRIDHTSDPAQLAFSDPEMNEFLDGLPKRYLRARGREEITAHFALERVRRRDGVAVKIRREGGTLVASVLADDHPGLFAAICGALASFGMNILEAEAYANSRGTAIDVVRFADPLATLDLNPGETARLEWTVGCVVKGAIDVRDLLKRRKQVKHHGASGRRQPVIRFNNDASDSSTLLEFVGEDRPGLLYALSSTLAAANCDIELVLADTEGRKAVDVFYVTKDKAKLEPDVLKDLEIALAAAGTHTA
ncbi:MAG: HD domain-containing protein [Acidobacteriaceae bacterium]|nr:HD domain-containing protein [Acidobacteriaceae bacterium]